MPILKNSKPAAGGLRSEEINRDQTSSIAASPRATQNNCGTALANRPNTRTPVEDWAPAGCFVFKLERYLGPLSRSDIAELVASWNASIRLPKVPRGPDYGKFPLIGTWPVAKGIVEVRRRDALSKEIWLVSECDAIRLRFERACCAYEYRMKPLKRSNVASADMFVMKGARHV
jgi:hypothetical protein